ncbi:MAG TPA: hypothetical protein PKC97_00875 [Burkholderiaceae bacterium]|jgi:hypothetical protein|nr:hypothetical protein [Burkholderiaceae bacterium]
MMSIALWSVCAAALLACGWFASSWFHQRKIGALRERLEAVRNTAAEHANQARRQIAQLQVEIESRKAAMPPPPRRASEPAPRVVPGQVQVQTAAAATGKPVQRFVADADLVAPAGFAHTTIVPRDGFASTEVMA